MTEQVLHKMDCNKIKATVIRNSHERKKLLKNLPGWSIQSKILQREFYFETYQHEILFLNAIFYLAETQDHHPNLVVGYKKCLVEFTTHSVQGITLKDFIMAAKINVLVP